MGYTNFPNGLTSQGVPLLGNGSTNIAGNTYFVDATNGSDGNNGKEVSKAFQTITKAFTVLAANDVVYCLPGNYTGNYSTPLNSVAPFCSLIGINSTDKGFGPWAGSSSATTPIIDVRARGWRISGFEFDGPATAAAVVLTKSGTSNANYTQIDNCLFTGAGTGQDGIDFVGAPTYVKIQNNDFDGFLAKAITCSNSATDTPNMTQILNNKFSENINHIDMDGRGLKSGVIKGNTFHLDGISRDALILVDNAGGGGTSIVENYFDCTAAQYTDDGATAFIRTSATDFGAGNMCSDGAAAALISV